ncbi:uncharacterized protein LOC132533810 [Erinaceus europaeus]|uniref:Uncharacterized protein LOC132533810 n=1 Tax=Erinaceus europaeus TaxID=9365 RepID=A0ABM3W5N2_ERIEU|nr:uncharacterized protein LOC132533810 [Erinaceus europaeus]XP_060031884.1 uncharacterized protein LOC132533810 [Erinaceus europaeus]
MVELGIEPGASDTQAGGSLAEPLRALAPAPALRSSGLFSCCAVPGKQPRDSPVPSWEQPAVLSPLTALLLQREEAGRGTLAARRPPPAARGAPVWGRTQAQAAHLARPVTARARARAGRPASHGCPYPTGTAQGAGPDPGSLPAPGRSSGCVWRPRGAGQRLWQAVLSLKDRRTALLNRPRLLGTARLPAPGWEIAASELQLCQSPLSLPPSSLPFFFLNENEREVHCIKVKDSGGGVEGNLGVLVHGEDTVSQSLCDEEKERREGGGDSSLWRVWCWGSSEAGPERPPPTGPQGHFWLCLSICLSFLSFSLFFNLYLFVG